MSKQLYKYFESIGDFYEGILIRVFPYRKYVETLLSYDTFFPYKNIK